MKITDLEYRLGKLNVNLSRLRLQDTDPYEAAHKFIIEAKGNSVCIYVGEAVGHIRLGLRLEIPEERLVGGGFCYLDDKEQLVLHGYSGEYHSIPQYAAKKFADLIKPELEKTGIVVSGIAINTSQESWRLNPFWK